MVPPVQGALQLPADLQGAGRHAAGSLAAAVCHWPSSRTCWAVLAWGSSSTVKLCLGLDFTGEGQQLWGWACPQDALLCWLAPCRVAYGVLG